MLFRSTNFAGMLLFLNRVKCGIAFRSSVFCFLNRLKIRVAFMFWWVGCFGEFCFLLFLTRFLFLPPFPTERYFLLWLWLEVCIFLLSRFNLLFLFLFVFGIRICILRIVALSLFHEVSDFFDGSFYDAIVDVKN